MESRRREPLMATGLRCLSWREWDNGQLESFICFSSGGYLHGVNIDYNSTGRKLAIEYYLKGNKVDKETYSEAQKKDATLPPVFENPQKYKELLSQEIKDLIELYKLVEPVKIPLKFDAEGKIITKSGKVFVLPK